MPAYRATSVSLPDFAIWGRILRARELAACGPEGPQDTPVRVAEADPTQDAVRCCSPERWQDILPSCAPAPVVPLLSHHA